MKMKNELILTPLFPIALEIFSFHKTVLLGYVWLGEEIEHGVV
jgi:hypothetical protein